MGYPNADKRIIDVGQDLTGIDGSDALLWSQIVAADGYTETILCIAVQTAILPQLLGS